MIEVNFKNMLKKNKKELFYLQIISKDANEKLKICEIHTVYSNLEYNCETFCNVLSITEYDRNFYHHFLFYANANHNIFIVDKYENMPYFKIELYECVKYDNTNLNLFIHCPRYFSCSHNWVYFDTCKRSVFPTKCQYKIDDMYKYPVFTDKLYELTTAREKNKKIVEFAKNFAPCNDCIICVLPFQELY